jgi:hypothetical protein
MMSTQGVLDKASLIDLICKQCEFYKDSDKELECGAFKILKGLLEKGVITPKEIIDVLRE